MHYQGKTHDKHVRSYFTSLNKLNSLNSAAAPIPQKLGASGQKGGKEDEGSLGRPPGLHCSVCDLAFTSFSQVWIGVDVFIHYFGSFSRWNST